MTRDISILHNYKPFNKIIPVQGISNLTLYATGQGEIILLSNEDIHKLQRVWYVPLLQDSIISKQWTKNSNLQTMMDVNENIVLKSTISNFITITQTIDGMTIFPSLTTIPTHGTSGINPATAKITNSL